MLRFNSIAPTIRSLTSTSSCVSCQRRFAHAMIEVELIKDIVGVGLVGERKILSRGFVRNVLIPRQQALVVVRGKIASPLRDMMIRERRVASLVNLSKVQVAPEKVEIENKIKTKKEVIDPLAVLEAAETLLAEALSFLPILSFQRRLITPSLPSSASSSSSIDASTTASTSATSSFLGSTAEKTITGKAIYGSVTEGDVITLLKEYGITIEEGMGSFEVTDSVEKGRIKGVGKFTFVVRLKAIEESVKVQLEVSEEK